MQGPLALKPWVRELGRLGLRRNRRGLTEDGDPRARFEEEEFCWLVVELGVWGEGRIEATRAESQWIVAARPLCHLQYPVAYLSRLQKILLIAQ